MDKFECLGNEESGANYLLKAVSNGGNVQISSIWDERVGNQSDFWASRAGNSLNIFEMMNKDRSTFEMQYKVMIWKSSDRKSENKEMKFNEFLEIFEHESV